MSFAEPQLGHGREFGLRYLQGTCHPNRVSTRVTFRINLGSLLFTENHPSPLLMHSFWHMPVALPSHLSALTASKPYLAAPGWWSSRGIRWSQSSPGHMYARDLGSWTPPSPGYCTSLGCSTGPCMLMRWCLLFLKWTPRSPWTGILSQTWHRVFARQVLGVHKPPQAGSGAHSQSKRDF